MPKVVVALAFLLLASIACLAASADKSLQPRELRGKKIKAQKLQARELKKNKSKTSKKGRNCPPVITPRGVLETPIGLLAYRAAGSLQSKKTPIICLHMSPRSSDEYTEILPLLSDNDDGDDDDDRFVIALDSPGFGFSAPQTRELDFDETGDMVAYVADCLGMKDFAVIGSLYGAYIAMNVAARYPKRVESVVLNNPYKFLDALVQQAQQGVVLDFDFFPDFVFNETGSHFLQIWNLRQDFVDPLLNTRLTQDHMTYQVNGLESTQNLGVERLLPFNNALFDWQTANQIEAPVLALFGEIGLQIFDLFGLDATGQMPEALQHFSNVNSQIISGGTLWQMNEIPETLAPLIVTHIDENS